MIRLESLDLLGCEGHCDRVFDFSFSLRGRRSLWHCVVGVIGTIVVRGWSTRISRVICMTGKNRCSLIPGTPLRRVYRKMRAVGCRCSHEMKRCANETLLFVLGRRRWRLVASGRRGGLPSPCLSLDPLTRWMMILCGGSKLRQNVVGPCVGPMLG
jgi:hypothetical protein